MDRKTGSFTVVDGDGQEHTVDEYHDLMASGALGMRHHVMEDGRKVTNIGDGRFVIDETQEVLTLRQPVDEAPERELG
jgi:hypothetical protein